MILSMMWEAGRWVTLHRIAPNVVMQYNTTQLYTTQLNARRNTVHSFTHSLAHSQRGVKRYLIRQTAEGQRASFGSGQGGQAGGEGPPPKYLVGMRVEARYRRGQKWFAGTVRKVNMNGTYDVDYDMAGANESNVPEESIRAAPEGDTSDLRARRPSLGITSSTIPEDAIKLESPRWIGEQGVVGRRAECCGEREREREHVCVCGGGGQQPYRRCPPHS